MNKLLKTIALIKKILSLYRQLLILKLKKKKGYSEFALAIRKRESDNNYQAVNQFGYLGAYQFGMARLSDLGYTERKPGRTGMENTAFQWKTPEFSQERFLNDSDFQDNVFRQHVNRLTEYFEPNSYIGLSVGGIKITLSGLVAGAHLGGIGGVKKFLSTNVSGFDAFGTKISDYIREFKGYDLLKVVE